jgi:2-oxoglutarate ferredoxin oxidoreductase subunit alpha
MFPSNIQGLPTWYQVRANSDGYGGRKDVIDVMVAFNETTIAEDVHKVRPGGVLIYDNSTEIPEDLKRDDLTCIGVPAVNLIKEKVKAGPLRIKQRNMVYVGVIAQLFGIDLSVVGEVLADTFGKKPQVIESNQACIQAGYDYVEQQNFSQEVARLESIENGNLGKIITEGNTASALGAVYGGATVVAWYPITPSTSLADAMEHYLPRLRLDADKKATFAVIQAEDEIAAAGMVVGAGWAGSRSMTTTSGPGLSLMNEMIGLAYFGEVPSVFFIVQRGGPSTGLPTRTQQSDLISMYYCSHGDTRHIVLLPHDMRSSFELGQKSFNLAEKFQTPVFVASDLDLGMNLWTSEPFEFCNEPIHRGKVLNEQDLRNKGEQFQRFLDEDGDGIASRTIPGNSLDSAGYFTSGALQDSAGKRSEDNEVYRQNLDRLKLKLETARREVPRPVIESTPGVSAGVISFGSSFESTREARDRLTSSGYPTDHLLLRALPLGEEVKKFIEDHDVVYLVEQNRDGQMLSILLSEWPELNTRLRSVRIYDGLPVAAGEIVHCINRYRELH